MPKYNPYTEEQKYLLLKYVSSLSEKERRHFLAIQYKQLGIGSQRYIAEVFKCSRITITKGVLELKDGGNKIMNYSHQRKTGGGRKKKVN